MFSLKVVYGPPGSGKTKWIQSMDAIEIYPNEKIGRHRLRSYDMRQLVLSCPYTDKQAAILAAARVLQKIWSDDLTIDIYQSQHTAAPPWTLPSLQESNIPVPVYAWDSNLYGHAERLRNGTV